MSILLTGCAGFIGSHLLDRLIKEGHHVVGVDNFDPSYDRASKERNLAPYRRAKHLNDSSHLQGKQGSSLHPSASGRLEFLEADLAKTDTYEQLDAIFKDAAPEAILHFAGKSAVRASFDDPTDYLTSNLTPTRHLLDYSRRHGIPHFIFASCSSVYGRCPERPWKECFEALHPLSPYATIKLSCEKLGKAYSRCYGFRFTALRLFNVYGPRQRPDLTISQFAECIRKDQPFPLHGAGDSCHAYTYIDDIVDGIYAALDYKGSDFEIFNLGHPQSIRMRDLLKEFESCLGVRAKIETLPEQKGELSHSSACLEKSRQHLDYQPRTRLNEGLLRFAQWFLESDEADGEADPDPGL